MRSRTPCYLSAIAHSLENFGNNMQSLAVLLAAGVLTFCNAFQSGSIPATAPSPIPESAFEELKFDPAQTVCLFVGVRDFTNPLGTAGQHQEVPYAVDDAIDLAYLFIKELRLGKADNTYLAISGKPQKKESSERLEVLKKDGVYTLSPTYTGLIWTIEEISKKAGDKGMIVMSFSTHGFMDDKNTYLTAMDTISSRKNSTSLPLTVLQDSLSAAKSPRKIVLMDACRTRSRNGSDPQEMQLSKRLMEAVANFDGTATISAAAPGARSYDDDQRQNGVFTTGILDGLTGAAEADDQGFITVDLLSKYTNDRVSAWVREKHPEVAIKDLGIGVLLEPHAIRKLPLARRVEKYDAVKKAFEKKKQLLKNVRNYKDEYVQLRDQWRKIEYLLEESHPKEVLELMERLAKLDDAQEKGVNVIPEFIDWWNTIGYKILEWRDLRKSIAEFFEKWNGEAHPPNEEELRKLVARASASSYPPAIAIEALLAKRELLGYDKSIHKGVDIEEILKLATDEFPAVYHLVGHLYYYAVLEKNDRLAFEWYKKAAEAGHGLGMTSLGVCYDNGLGTEKNRTLAFQWYKKAAEARASNGMTSLGFCYANGLGTEKNHMLAFQWYKEAAEAGHGLGMTNLGGCYAHGNGTAQDSTLAFQWYKKAAEAGEIYGMTSLGFCYTNGTGTEKNASLAIAWWKKAAKLGNQDAQKNLTTLGEKWE